ncbi:hypothetical protein CCHL11_04198 [Colletotrichum chlorophyti]|uniref:Uncharacterized protein n=1 Tax=Colletotrichum chlorophyti TaxID=708187 RepID=A0A1Q8RPF0_9PEZI|nr:hypothetical protein CCHL11_04198 [Colletotrichum chlorophyti]
MADTIVLETHIYSKPTNGSPTWSRSFHLRLPLGGTKADLLDLIRASVTRLGRSDAVVEPQITLYLTRNGRILSFPGTPNLTTTTTPVPIYQQPQIMSINTNPPPMYIQQQINPGYPLAMTNANGINYLHSYGPGSCLINPYPSAGQQVLVVGGGQVGFINVNVPAITVSGHLPIVLDVVKEARLDTVLEDRFAAFLEWAVGPTGLKLIVAVDIDGRHTVSIFDGPPEPSVRPASVTSTTPAAPPATPAIPPDPSDLPAPAA